MPIIHKTFTKVVRCSQHVENEAIDQIVKAYEDIDNEVNAFTANQHWAQARDAFQETVLIPTLDYTSLVITRTYVFTTEQPDKTIMSNRPPVG